MGILELRMPGLRAGLCLHGPSCGCEDELLSCAVSPSPSAHTGMWTLVCISW